MERLEADILIYGTGLVSSLVAVGLSSHGIKVILIDPNTDYGSNYRTLNLKNYIIQILNGIETHRSNDDSLNSSNTKIQNFSSKDENPKFIFNPFNFANDGELSQGVENDHNIQLTHFNDFHIDLWPKILYGNSLAVTSLVGTGCDNYVQFTAVEGSYIHRNGTFSPVPGTKSAIFRSEDFTPLQKRYLWRFLSGIDNITNFPKPDEFENDESNDISTSDIIYYGLGRYHDKDKVNNMLARVKMYISSIGIYGRYYSPFIYPLYGTSDMIQAFARASSLTGTICMLRSRISKSIINSTLPNNQNHQFNMSFMVDTYGMGDNELDVSTSEISCNIIITESHLQDIPNLNQVENKYHLVIQSLNVHIAIIVSNEKLLKEGISTCVLLEDSQSYLLQLDSSSGTVPQGYYVYYMMGVIDCDCGIVECPYIITIKGLFEKSKINLSSILFASHHYTAPKSKQESVDGCYKYGMMMKFVDEITMAIKVIRSIKAMLPDGKFEIVEQPNEIVEESKDEVDSENECKDLIFKDRFEDKKKDSWILDRLTALVEEFDGYSLDVDVNNSNQN